MTTVVDERRAEWRGIERDFRDVVIRKRGDRGLRERERECVCVRERERERKIEKEDGDGVQRGREKTFPQLPISDLLNRFFLLSSSLPFSLFSYGLFVYAPFDATWSG